MRRVLVIGGDGTIGRAIGALLAARGIQIVETTRHPSGPASRAPDSDGRDRLFLDLLDDPGKVALPERIDVAYMCAGVASLADCRNDPAGSARVNVTGTLAVARRLATAGTHVVALLTSQVFNGTAPRTSAEAPRCPRTEYGRQKVAMEEGLLALGEQGSLVRLTKVVSPTLALLSGWIAALRTDRAVRAFSDMVMAPVALTDVVEALGTIGERRLSGIIQLSAPEDAAYTEVARHLARRLGRAETRVEAVSARDAGLLPEDVPAHTALDTTRAERELGWRPCPALAVVDRVFRL